MDISFHPRLRKEAHDLEKFLKNNRLDDDINYVIGGDGTLLLYASAAKPNFLISPASSVGYYAFARLDNRYEAIYNYLNCPKRFNKEYLTISAEINGKKVKDSALNEVLITEGLNLTSKMRSSLDNFAGLEINSGFIAYTYHGWSGFAKNLGIKNVEESKIGLASIAQSNGLIPNNGMVLPEKFSIQIVPRNRKTRFLMYLDCIDIKPYNPFCSSKKSVRTKPYVLRPDDEITLKKGTPIIIASK